MCSVEDGCVQIKFEILEVVDHWFKSSEFLFLMSSSYRCDSPEKLKSLLPRLEQELKDSGKFKDFYQFTFNFAKNPGQKGLGSSEKHSP